MQSFLCRTFLLLLSIRCLCGSRLNFEEFSDKYNRNAFECLDALISVTNWVVHDFLIISDDMDVVDDIFFQRSPNFRWKLHSVRNNNLTGFSNSIFFTNNFDTFKETISAINFRRMDNRAKFVISLAKNFASLDEIKTASKGISTAMWKLDKTHVLYLVPCKEDILAMTYFPFANNCQVGELEVVDIWRKKIFENGTELFPQKMLDIHGCVQYHSNIFREIIAFQLRKELTETGEMILGGVAGRLIGIVAEKMNMDLRLLPKEPESWDILVNQIVVGESLFSIAGNIPTASRLEYLDLESSFMEESFGFGYVTNRIEVSWKNLVWLLPHEVWVCIGCTFLIFIGIIFLENRRDHRATIAPDKLTILDSFGIFLGSTRLLPRSYFGRYLVGLWIVYSFLINVYYNSGLVSFLTTPNEQRVINTLEELLTDGIDFGGGTFHREFYNDSSDPVMMKIYNNYKIWSADDGRILPSNGHSVGIFSSTVDQYNSDHIGDVHCQLRILKEKAFTFHAPIFMRRGSPFVIGVHRYTLQVIESGLFEYWRKYYTRALHSAGKGADTHSRISMKHLRGILYLYIVGLICSSIAFLGELIFHKYFSNHNFC